MPVRVPSINRPRRSANGQQANGPHDLAGRSADQRTANRPHDLAGRSAVSVCVRAVSSISERQRAARSRRACECVRVRLCPARSPANDQHQGNRRTISPPSMCPGNLAGRGNRSYSRRGASACPARVCPSGVFLAFLCRLLRGLCLSASVCVRAVSSISNGPRPISGQQATGNGNGPHDLAGMSAASVSASASVCVRACPRSRSATGRADLRQRATATGRTISPEGLPRPSASGTISPRP